MSASRSIFLKSPKNQIAFTLKGSTNCVGGVPEGLLLKVMTGEEAKNLIKASEYATALMPEKGLKSLILFLEPLAFAIDKKGNLPSKGIVIRDLQDLGQDSMTGKKFSYIPGFSLAQDKNLPLLIDLVAKSMGIKAQSVSYNDLNNFVLNHYLKPAAKAMAELLAYFGINRTSLHGQQLLLQIDAEGKPTGKIVLRDFTDANLLKKNGAKTI